MPRIPRITECHADRPHFAKGFCKSCYYKHLKAANPEWHRRNEDKLKAYRKTPAGQIAKRKSYRKCHLKQKYGLTLAAYEALLSAQGRTCALCFGVNTRKIRTGQGAPLSVDHCHATGAVRGLLCGNCNTALHAADRDIGWLDRARAYLDRRDQS